MVLETDTTQLPDIAAAAPPEPASEPAEPVAEPTVEPESAESPEPTPRTWETIRAEAEADPTVKTEFETWVAEKHEESRKQGRKDVQDRVESTLRVQRQAADAAYRGVEEIKGQIVRGLRDGSITEQGLADALSANNSALMAYNALRGIDQSTAGVKGLINLMAGDNAELVKKYHARVDDFVQGYESDTAIATDLLDELTDARIDKAKKPLQNKINTLEAEIEKLKATGRDGKGPDSATKVVSPGGIKSMDEADRRFSLPTGHPEALGIDEYKEARSRFGIK
jgi:hypothetical protein